MSVHELRVLTLGPLVVTLDGIEVADLGIEKHRALLAYLAVDPTKVHSRAHLASMLWPEVADDKSRQSLREALYRIRRAFDSTLPATDEETRASDTVLAITRSTVGFADATEVGSDAATFKDLVAMARSHRHATIETCESCIDLLRQAADLYRGDFLSGLAPDEAPEFDDWISVQRQMYQNFALTTFERLVEICQQTSRDDEAIHMAFRTITIDAYREESHRGIMRMLARQGLHGRAIEHFEKFSAMLADELDVSPAIETVQLADQIRAGDIARSAPIPARSEAAPVELAPSRHLPLLQDPGPLPPRSVLPFHRNIDFAGRETELTEIATELASEFPKADNTPKVVALTGRPEIGKSHLAIEFAFRYGRNFAGGVTWIDFSDPAVARQQIAELADDILTEPGTHGSEHRVAAVKRLWESNESRLLIFDGCEDLDLAATWIPESGAASVLITSRQRSWPVELPLSDHKATGEARRGEVLVVDDTAANLQVLCAILEEDGYEVRPAISGDIALTAIEAAIPDLILLDVMMPGMSGFEVCSTLKRNPRFAEIPVIFISALSDTPDKVTAFQAGGVDYVTKPFQADEVLARVNLHMRLHTVTGSLRRSNADLKQAVDRLSEASPTGCEA